MAGSSSSSSRPKRAIKATHKMAVLNEEKVEKNKRRKKNEDDDAAPLPLPTSPKVCGIQPTSDVVNHLAVFKLCISMSSVNQTSPRKKGSL